LNGHTQDVKSIKWHPTKNILFSSSYDNTIKLWMDELEDWNCISTLTGHDSSVWFMAFNNRGDILLSASEDKTIGIWKEIKNEDAEEDDVYKYNWKLVNKIEDVHERSVYSIDYSKDDKYFITGCGDNKIRIFTLKENFEYQIVNIIDAHDTDINCVSFNPKNSQIFASCSDDFEIKVWNLNN
jgi:WD40 repeat protein